MQERLPGIDSRLIPVKVNVKPRYWIISFLAGIAAYFAAPSLTRELSEQTGIAGVLFSVAAYVCVVVLLLAPAVTLIWFLFRVWGKTYYRAWHIQRIRNNREMRRVLLRGEHEE